MVNVVDLDQLIKVKNNLDKVLEGKVEHLPELKEAHRIITELVEHKKVTLWKYTLDE